MNNDKNNRTKNKLKIVRATYKTIYTLENVLVPIVNANAKYMRRDKKHIFKTTQGIVTIAEHFVHGLLLPDGHIMYRHYFVNENMLGKSINAVIEVVQKDYLDGRKQWILNVKPMEGKSQYKLKIITDKPNRDEALGVLLYGNNGSASTPVGKVACKKLESVK